MIDKYKIWLKNTTKIQEDINTIFSILKSKYKKESGNIFLEMKRQKLKQILSSGLTRGESVKVVTYHLLCGGTPPLDQCEKFDFDGDLSIEKFFKDTLEKLKFK